jgi:DNA-binding NarL/FixJ family response regulator
MVEANEDNLSFDLVLLSPPAYNDKGFTMIEESVRLFSPSPVMIFSNTFSKRIVMKSIESGITAYFSKGISPFELEGIMNELTVNKNFPDIKLELKVRRVLSNDEQINVSFTEVEEEVLRLVCQQKSSSEISHELGISVRTVESRKRNMMLKTNSKNMIGVVMIFIRSGHFQNPLQLPAGP